MPSVSSPAITQTANGADMYVPIAGPNLTILPPIITGNPITEIPIGLPPFISSITGVEPITINNQFVRVEYTSSLNYSYVSSNMSTIYVSSFLSTNALTVNGPVRMTYATDLDNFRALNIVGDVEFNSISANVLEAVRLFNIPISFVLFTDEYGMQEMSVFDMGGLRFVFGNTNLGIASEDASAPTFVLQFNDVPANTIPNQTQTGLFNGKCNCIGNIIYQLGQFGQPTLYGVNTQNQVGNAEIYTTLQVNAEKTLAGRCSFLAIGIAKV